MAEKDHKFIVKHPSGDVYVSAEDIDDIMDSAMSGCTYWCGSAEPLDGYLGEYASEQISRGGILRFYPIEDDPIELSLPDFEKGLTKWLSSMNDISAVLYGKWIDPGQIDAIEADSILQYALFDDIIYG